MEIEEIAKTRKLQPGTVKQYLMNLHRAKIIDLRSWADDRLDSKEMEKGISYFLEARDKRLEVAHNSLGLDYDLLRFCRLFAEEKTGEPLAAAS